MSALPVSQIDATSLSTPAGMHIVTVALTHEPDQLHTFTFEVYYGPDDVAAMTMQLHTLSAALMNPGTLIDEGRSTVVADTEHGDVAFYLPMGAAYAVLHLAIEGVQEFVSTVQANISQKWSAALDAQVAAERAVVAFADEGIDALNTWLADQGEF